MAASVRVKEALAYHGTSVECAKAILAGELKPSRNWYDWLGDGLYFFQDAPDRAWEWAERCCGADAAVVGARLCLADCIDLLDIAAENLLRNAYEGFAQHAARIGRPLPKQTGKLHGLDREVINYAAGILRDRGVHVAAVRGAFEEGNPVYPDSAILSRAHVQIAVRDRAAILELWMESRKAVSDPNAGH